MFDSNDKYSKTNSLSTSLSKALQNSKFQNFTSCWTTFESFSQKNVFLVLSSFWQLTKQFAFCYFMLLCTHTLPQPTPLLTSDIMFHRCNLFWVQVRAPKLEHRNYKSPIFIRRGHFGLLCSLIYAISALSFRRLGPALFVLSACVAEEMKIK